MAAPARGPPFVYGQSPVAGLFRLSQAPLSIGTLEDVRTVEQNLRCAKQHFVGVM